MAVTKKLMKEYMKTKLSSDTLWALRGLMVVYSNQSAEEQAAEFTKHQNGIGFTGTDGNFLTSLAKQYKNRKCLSQNQMHCLLKSMSKYWKQILNASDEKKLLDCMKVDGYITEDDIDRYMLNKMVDAL